MSVGEEFVLCGGGAECIGVGHGVKEGQVLVSFSSGAVQVYDVCECRLVCGWQLPDSELLACAAVANSSTALYWAIGSKLSVSQWNDDTTPTAATPLLHIDANPIQLLVSRGNHPPLVVYSNGGVGRCVEKKEAAISLAPRERGGMWVVVMADICGGGGLVCVVCVNAKRKSVSVGVVYVAEDEEVRLERQCVSIVSKKTELLSCCVCGDQLWMLCGNGDLLCVSLEPRLHPVHLCHTIPSPAPSTHILALSADYFILAHAHCLQLWDTRYCTCQHVTTVTQRGSKVWCVEECVWGGDGGLKGWRVEMGVANLATALGKRTQTVKATPTILTSWPSNNMNLLNWSDNVVESSVVSDLVDPAKTPTLKSFCAVFGGLSLSGDDNVCVSSVVERLLAEKRFWGRRPLRQLLEAGLVASNMDVIGAVAARDDWGLVMTCLSCGVTPTEKCLVSTLQLVLSLQEVVVSKGETVSRSDLIVKLLCQPFTDVMLHPALAVMDFSTIKELLSFLSEHISVAYLLAPPSSHSSLPYNTILEWVGIILDVHFTRLLLDSDSRQLLLTMQDQVLSQVRCFSRLSPLLSLSRVQTNWVKHNADNWLYKVEKLHI